MRHQQVAEQFNSGSEVAELTTALFLAGCESRICGSFSCLAYTHTFQFVARAKQTLLVRFFGL